MASKFAEPSIKELDTAKTISGPFSQFDNSVIFEYVEPPASLNATHTFYPCADAQEDTTIYLWAHPEKVPDPMDRLFFQTLLGYISDVYEKKAPMSVLQIMVTQHASATAMVMFPRAWWLGPLRWWIPWQLQGLAATIGRFFGYKGLIEKHTAPEEWANYLHSKRS
ncbi:hypothetical protein N0V90_005596 [Kalmusia sp. IMI 367209]|nr:hypothetical protein N0V90_005596 [Kalmusia sp. IMI 367209]